MTPDELKAREIVFAQPIDALKSGQIKSVSVALIERIALALCLTREEATRKERERCVEKIQRVREKYVEHSPTANKVLWEAIEEIKFKGQAIEKEGV